MLLLKVSLSQKIVKRANLKSNANSINQRAFIILMGALLISSCDFTPRIHQQILHAQSLITSNRYIDAIQEYEKILEGNPPAEMKMKIYYQLGELYANNLGKNQKAIESFSKVSEFTVEPVWLVRAEERMADINFSYLKDYSESLKNYERLVKFTPRLLNYDFYELRLAQSALLVGKSERAQDKFKEIIANTQHEYNTRAIYEMGSLHFEKQDWQEAINYLSDYIKKEKRRDSVVQAKFLMANAHETMEELQTAYNLYYSILGEYPNTQVIQNRLRSIYERRVARKR